MIEKPRLHINDPDRIPAFVGQMDRILALYVNREYAEFWIALDEMGTKPFIQDLYCRNIPDILKFEIAKTIILREV